MDRGAATIRARPITGEYTLTNADLSTINGIGGILQSSGKYEGRLTKIITVGEAQTRDFSLDLGGKPVPLETRFHTVVDGTDGSTRLVRVDAKLRNTSFSTWGTIANLSGPGRHAIDLEFDVKDGRIEDLLALSIDSPQPLLTGKVPVQGTLRCRRDRPRCGAACWSLENSPSRGASSPTRRCRTSSAS